jgi:hypothetical protein
MRWRRQALLQMWRIFALSSSYSPSNTAAPVIPLSFFLSWWIPTWPKTSSCCRRHIYSIHSFISSGQQTVRRLSKKVLLVEEKRFRMKSYTCLFVCLFVVCFCRMLDSLVAYNMRPPWRQEIVPVIKLVGQLSTQHLAFVEFALCIQLSWPSNLLLKKNNAKANNARSAV